MSGSGCDYLIPANILISGKNNDGHEHLITELLEQMDYSDIWCFSPQKRNYKEIGHLDRFIQHIIECKPVRDNLLILIDQPTQHDIRDIRKLLHISKQYDIIVIIATSGDLPNHTDIIRYIDLEYMYNSNDVYTIHNYRIEA